MVFFDEVLPDRRIGRRGFVDYSSHSPDLVSLHFFSFGFTLKAKCMPRVVCCCIVMLYRIVILSTVFVFFLLFGRDDEIINFKSEIREPVVSKYDIKENLFLKF